MNIDAPTFNALNRPQKRALILRDQLRFLDPQHLDSFLEGVSNFEPPTYTRINGVIKPELMFVTLKAEATYFDLGNVLLSEDNNAIHRVYLVAENNQIQMRTEDLLPQDDDVLDSIPIHGFIARGMVPLFKEKFQAMLSRMNRINEARRVAYAMACERLKPSHEGETLTMPNPPKTKQFHTASPSKSLESPKTKQQLKQHASNKRKRPYLDGMPEDAKRGILDTIPCGIKVSIFDNIVKTAFPHFENAITASRHVVSIYSTCGSDFAALHRAIVDLKRVLDDFDKVFGKHADREPPRYRHDFVDSSSSHADRHAETHFVSASPQNAVNNPAQQTARPPPSQQQQQARTVERQISDSDPDEIPHADPRLPPCTPSSNKPQHHYPSALLHSVDPHHLPVANITTLHQESVQQFQTSKTASTPAHTWRSSIGQATAQTSWSLSNSLLEARKTGGMAPVANMLPCMRRKEGVGMGKEV